MAELVNGTVPENLKFKSGPIPVKKAKLKAVVTVTAGGAPEGVVLVTEAPLTPAAARILCALLTTAGSFAVSAAVVAATRTASRAAWFIVLTINQARPNSTIPKVRSKNRGRMKAVSRIADPSSPPTAARSLLNFPVGPSPYCCAVPQTDRPLTIAV